MVGSLREVSRNFPLQRTFDLLENPTHGLLRSHLGPAGPADSQEAPASDSSQSLMEDVESSVALKVETVVVELIPPEYQVFPLALVEVALLDQ